MPMKKLTLLFSVVLLLGLLPLQSANAYGNVACKMRYSLKGWSLFYQTAKGSGIVTCSNGQRLHVVLETKGGGLTIGRSEIHDGKGRFSGVHTIRDVLGSYASANAHAGAAESSSAQVLTKGNVSLALAGVGQGWNLGVAFGKFVIKPVQ